MSEEACERQVEDLHCLLEYYGHEYDLFHGQVIKIPEMIKLDKCMGLVEAAVEFYPDARWQRCVVGLLKKGRPSCILRYPLSAS